MCVIFKNNVQPKASKWSFEVKKDHVTLEHLCSGCEMHFNVTMFNVQLHCFFCYYLLCKAKYVCDAVHCGVKGVPWG